MFNTIGRILVGIILVLIGIALAEEFIKKPELRIIYYAVGVCILIGLLVKMCSGNL